MIALSGAVPGVYKEPKSVRRKGWNPGDGVFGKTRQVRETRGKGKSASGGDRKAREREAGAGIDERGCLTEDPKGARRFRGIPEIKRSGNVRE